MNYPVWLIPQIGGGLLIAIIAVTHVFISHLAVGGGLFLVVNEMIAVRNKDRELLRYVKRHTRFFLLLTMVYGGITGVGIWWIISLVSPAGTSTLIHTYVFGWATEWVCFIGEITALLIYYYKFDSMKASDHIKIGWLYFIFAWLSLFIINGIISFMLTPGDWVETGKFWDGFFNPSFIPSTIFRTGLAVMIAGLFGLVTAVFSTDEALRRRLIRINLKWFYLPMIVLPPSAVWYLYRLSERSRANILGLNPEAFTFLALFLLSSIALIVLGLFFILKCWNPLRKVGVIVLVLIGLSWMGGFEYLREIARKPYVISNYMYTNSVRLRDIKKYQENGYLRYSKWSQIKEVTPENQLEAGRELFNLQCTACHTVNGYNSVMTRTEFLTERGIMAVLSDTGKFNTYMPPFPGNEVEKEALSAYIAQTLHHKTPWKLEKTVVDRERVEVPPFNARSAKYALFAYNDLGMHCISDNDKYWSFLPPSNTLMAQLIKRGPRPKIITKGVTITFDIQEAYRHPEREVDFWKYGPISYKMTLKEGKGLTGRGLTGEMDEDIRFNGFVAHAIPATPYQKDGDFNPYPVFTLKAIDKQSGKILAETKTVAPTSTEIGCRNCHDGDWRWNGKAGLSDTTSVNILRAHDRLSGTRLLEEAKNGNPKLCQSCHQDTILKTKGRPELLAFSASIHGFHARFLSGAGAGACDLCHPSRPFGRTSCSRGYHDQLGLNCVDCHGNIEDHALSLLIVEKDRKKPGAERLINSVTPVKVDTLAEINGRTPWVNEPDCLGCHTNYNHTQDSFVADGFNKWAGGLNGLYRFRTDGKGIMCVTCHGPPHANYGGENKYMKNRDNLQPIQFQNMAGVIGAKGNCAVCHTKKMSVEGHHKNMLRQD